MHRRWIENAAEVSISLKETDDYRIDLAGVDEHIDGGEPRFAVKIGSQAQGREEEAVTVYRRLAAANAAAYEPHLASSLNNLSLRVGRGGASRRSGARGA